MGQLATGRFRPLTFTRHRLSPLAVFTSGDPSSLISLVVSVDVKHHVYMVKGDGGGLFALHALRQEPRRSG